MWREIFLCCALFFCIYWRSTPYKDPDTRVSQRLLSRVEELYSQLPPNHTYDASLTTLLFVPSKDHQDLPDAISASQKARLAVEYDQWVWSFTGVFTEKHCRINGIYNRRTKIRQGECHVDVTSPEEHGCKTVWAPLCQFLPGWWQSMITDRTRAWYPEEFFSKGFEEQQWLIEREITLMHVGARITRCSHYATPGDSSSSRTLREKNSFFDSQKNSEHPEMNCQLPQPDRWNILGLLAYAESEMEAKGIERMTDSSHKIESGLLVKERAVDVFQPGNGQCPITGYDLCFLGRRRYEKCAEATA